MDTGNYTPWIIRKGDVRFSIFSTFNNKALEAAGFAEVVHSRSIS
jgi:hypothetical protein